LIRSIGWGPLNQWERVHAQLLRTFEAKSSPQIAMRYVYDTPDERFHLAEARTLKEIELIEVSLDELGGERPTAGNEATIRGVQYLVMEVQPPKTKSSKWKRKATDVTEQKWRLLVQKV
jgi:hypothetical protein